MKRLIGIALLFVLGAGGAQAGGIGGIGNGGAGLTVVYESSTHSLYIPGRLDERFEVLRRGVNSDSGLTVYYIEPGDFYRLQNALDSRQVINGYNDKGGMRSYRAVSGDQPQQVELIDRRAAIRNEVN